MLLKKLIVYLFCFTLIFFPSTARASMLGEENVLLLKQWIEDLKQTFHLAEIARETKYMFEIAQEEVALIRTIVNVAEEVANLTKGDVSDQAETAFFQAFPEAAELQREFDMLSNPMQSNHYDSIGRDFLHSLYMNAYPYALKNGIIVNPVESAFRNSIVHPSILEERRKEGKKYDRRKVSERDRELEREYTKYLSYKDLSLDERKKINEETKKNIDVKSMESFLDMVRRYQERQASLFHEHIYLTELADKSQNINIKPSDAEVLSAKSGTIAAKSLNAIEQMMTEQRVIKEAEMNEDKTEENLGRVKFRKMSNSSVRYYCRSHGLTTGICSGTAYKAKKKGK